MATLSKRALDRIAAELREVQPDPNLQPTLVNGALFTGWLTAVEAVAAAAHVEMGFDTNGNRRFNKERFMRAVGYRPHRI